MSECPHCYRNVIPKEDGICPACLEILNNTEGLDPEMTMLRIRQHQEIPRICIGCGEYCDNFTTIKHNIIVEANEEYGEDGGLYILATLVFYVLVFILLPIWIIFPAFKKILFHKKKFKHPIKIKLPVCAFCEETVNIEPQRINEDYFEMSFIVHKNFKDEFKNCQKKEY